MIFYFIFLVLFFYDNSYSKESENEALILNLKKQIVKTHNEFLEKKKQIEKLNLEISVSKQKQAIYTKKIDDKEQFAERIIFIFNEKKFGKKVSNIFYPLIKKNKDFIMEKVVVQSILALAKKDINSYLTNFSRFEKEEKIIEEKRLSLIKEKKKIDLHKTKLEQEINKKNILQLAINKKKKIKSKKFKSKNLKDLVKETSIRKDKLIKKKKANNLRLPVNGSIILDYGELSNYQKNKGIIFEPKKDSYIISPMDGTVEYAKKLKNYGNLVIIVNNEGYHSILSGMDEIITIEGNQVFAGEPIGRNTKSDIVSRIYFELRYKGKFIDPKIEVEIL